MENTIMYHNPVFMYASFWREQSIFFHPENAVYELCSLCLIESLGGAFLVQDPDGNKVVKEVIFGPGDKKYRYCKV